MEGEEKSSYDLYNELLQGYDNNRIYSSTVVGTENAYINLEKRVRSVLEAVVDMFIKLNKEIVAYKKANDEEIKEFKRLSSNLNARRNDFYVYNTDETKSEFERATKAMNNSKVFQTRDGKFLKRIKTKIPRNQLFFNVARQDGRDVDNENDELPDVKYYIKDDDINKYMYKTWVFTNVEDKILHTVDRNNRIGLIPIKKNINQLVFNDMKIPIDSKGIFIVKDSILARPEFEESMGLANSGSPLRTMGDLRSCSLRLMDKVRQTILQEGKVDYTKDDILRIAPPYLDTGLSRSDNINSTNNMFYIPKSLSPDRLPTIQDLVQAYRNEKYAHLNNNGIFNLNFEYANLFYGGTDSEYIQDLLTVNDNKKIINRWSSIVSNHYNNYNMDLGLSYNSHKVSKIQYDEFIKDKVGNLSNYVIKDPMENEVKDFIPDLACRLVAEKKSSFKFNPLEPEMARLVYDPRIGKYVNSKYLSPDDNSEILRINKKEGKAKHDIPTYLRIDENPISYGDMYQLKDTLDSYYDCYTVLSNDLLTNPDITTKYISNSSDYSKTIQASSALNTQTSDVFKQYGFTNGISFQDIIFIPIEYLDRNNGSYYEPEMDLVIVNNDQVPSTGIVHPGSKKATMDGLKVNALNSYRINIYSNNINTIGKVYYTKILGSVKPISVQRNNKLKEGIYVNSFGKDNVYDINETNLKMLNLYTNKEDAECNGMRNENIELLKYRANVKEQDTKVTVSDNSIKASSLSLEQIKWKIEYEREVNNNKLRMEELKFVLDIKKQITDYRQTNMKFMFQMRAAMNMEMVKSNLYNLRLKMEELKTIKAQMDLEKANLDNALTKYKTMYGMGSLIGDIIGSIF